MSKTETADRCGHETGHECICDQRAGCSLFRKSQKADPQNTRSSAMEDTETPDMAEIIAREITAEHYADRFRKPLNDPHVQMNVDGNWRFIGLPEVRRVLVALERHGYTWERTMKELPHGE